MCVCVCLPGYNNNDNNGNGLDGSDGSSCFIWNRKGMLTHPHMKRTSFTQVNLSKGAGTNFSTNLVLAADYDISTFQRHVFRSSGVVCVFIWCDKCEQGAVDQVDRERDV